MVKLFPARSLLALAICAFATSASVAEESSDSAPGGQTKIDFRKDIAPILQQHCVDCHGPEMQMAELRLDRREFVLPDDGRGLVKPGHSGDSLLIQRLTDRKLGILMPPTFPFFPGEKVGLAEDKVRILKTWIDQGAPWPKDVSLSAESKQAATDPAVSALFAAIREGDHAVVGKLLTGDLRASRDAHGSTPLIHAATYSDAKMLSLLLEGGCDVNAANHAGATPLCRGAGDVAKVQLLLDKGANVNVKTAMGRTPLLIAATYPGNVATVRLLLGRGATISDQDSFGETCLTSAAKRGDAEMVEALIEAGADLFAGSRPPLVWAAEEGNATTVASLLAHGAGKPSGILGAALCSAAARGPLEAVKLLLEHGADPNARSPMSGYTPLMLAAYSENVSAETVELLLAKGADPKVRSKNGETALSLAEKRGATVIVKLLKAAGENP